MPGRRCCTPTTRWSCAVTVSSRPCWCAMAGHVCWPHTSPDWSTSAAHHRAARPRRRRLPCGRRRGRVAVEWRRGRSASAVRPGAQESGDERTGYVTVSALPDRVRTARRDGVTAVTLDRGVPAYDVDAAPWSLAGAKSLSYASTSPRPSGTPSSLGAGDVVLVSSDGFVLEGPRSTVVIAPRPGVLQTPPPSSPHASRHHRARAVRRGARTRLAAASVEPLDVADMLVAQGVWLLSSVTLAARVTCWTAPFCRSLRMAAEVAGMVDAAVVGDG